MSQFTTPVVLEMLDHYKWRLVEQFEYHTEHICDGLPVREVDGSMYVVQIINVPRGYVTDLASVPRALWTIFPPHGRYAKAAIVHDYLYSNAIGSKRWADQVFFEAMGVLGVPQWRKCVMYWAVRLLGRGNYNKGKK